MYTTLNKIKMFGPPKDMWFAILAAANKPEAHDQTISLVELLEATNLYTATWCLRALSDQDSQVRLFAVACARAMPDSFLKARDKEVLEVAERFAQGDASGKDMEALWNTHWNAACGAIMATVRPNAADAALGTVRNTFTSLSWQTEMDGAWNGLSLSGQRRAAHKACSELQARQTALFQEMFKPQIIEDQLILEEQNPRHRAQQRYA